MFLHLKKCLEFLYSSYLPVLYFEDYFFNLVYSSETLLNFSTIRVGHTGMQVQHLIENILAVTTKLSQKLPEVES